MDGPGAESKIRPIPPRAGTPTPFYLPNPTMSTTPTDDSVSSLRVLVTGAAGRLGSVVCRHLVQAGLDVVGTDQHQPRGTPGHVFVQANLLDLTAVRSLLAGREVVVHLGNIPSAGQAPPVRTFNDNTAMNMNVMHSAAEAGVGTVIFASSVQTLSGTRRYRQEPRRPSPHPYLPLDGQTPACPGNTYGLSKQVGEVTLGYFCRVHGMSGVALRLPWMAEPGEIESLRSGYFREPRPWESLDEACAYLSYEDAARLILAILRARLTGFRIYFPVGPQNTLGWTAEEMAERFFAGVPHRKALEGDSVVDISQIERETGWRPVDEIRPAGAAVAG